jgi:endonuclease/exonuclease/phosphatase (EEP) superfamily protein YafD
VRTLTAAVLVAATAGALARVDWRLELACHVRAQYMWLLSGLAMALVGLRDWQWAAVAAAGAGVEAVGLWPRSVHQVATANGLRLRALLINVLRDSQAYDQVASLLEREQPDVAFLQETTEAWAAALQRLQSTFPFSVAVPRRDGFGMMLLSRRPIEHAEVVRIGPIAVPSIQARIRLGERAVTVIGTHPFAPTGGPRALLRRQQLAALAQRTAGMGGPVVILADLNTTPWSPLFRDLLQHGRLRDTRAGFGVQASWPSPLPAWMRIPIDHCLVSEEFAVRQRRIGPKVGSDHRPVIVDLVLRPLR